MAISARAQRLGRGWMVGAVATTIAAVSHSLAGGYRPGALSFGVALVFAGLLGTAVIGRRPSLPRLAVAVGGAQLAFHLLFSALGSASGAADSGMPAGMAAMAGMGGNPAALVVTSAHDHLADPAMWIAHTVAAVLTVLFLRRAEVAVWTMLTRLVSRIATRLTDHVTAVRVPASAPASPASAEVPPLVSRLLATSASRRGPPLLSF